MKPAIVGWGHTKFGALRDQSFEDMILSAAADAIAHAGIELSDIDGVWLGHFNSGMVKDAFASSLAFNLGDDLRFKPATRCENACASGSAAIYSALNAVRSGEARVALVVGAEKMTGRASSWRAERLG